VIPYALGGGGSRGLQARALHLALRQFGHVQPQVQGQIVRDKPYSAAEYSQLEAAWQKERQAALLRAAK